MQKHLLSLLTLALLLTPACQAFKNLSSELNETSIIKMRKGPCLGRCPVFEFQIDGLGEAHFEGEAFVKRKGVYTKQIDRETTRALFDAFIEADFFAFEDEYIAPVSDLPSTWITFIHRGQEKEILAYYDVPEKLRELIKMVDEIAMDENGWEGDEIYPEK